MSMDLACPHIAGNPAIAEALCGAVAAELSRIHDRPIAPSFHTDAPIRLMVSSADAGGWAGRLVWVLPGGTLIEGPMVETAILDADHLPSAAFEEFARTIVALTPPPSGLVTKGP